MAEKTQPRAVTDFKSEVWTILELANDWMEKNSRDEGRRYHTPDHPAALMSRVEMLAPVFGLSERQMQLVEIAIAWHDVVINFRPADPANIAAMITRNRGARKGDLPCGEQGNEAFSAKMALLSMEAANQRVGQTLFTEDDMQTVALAIDATYPEVNGGPNFQGVSFLTYPFYDHIVTQNPSVGGMLCRLARSGLIKGLCFYQPHLETPLERGEKVSLEVLVTALADLGGCGMDHFDEFALEGDLEFQEIHPNIGKPENLERLIDGRSDDDKARREKVVEAMVAWMRSQAGFVAWQMLRFEKIVYLLRVNKQLNARQEEWLRNIFIHYEGNIFGALSRAERVDLKYRGIKLLVNNSEAFRYLAREMRYLSI